LLGREEESRRSRSVVERESRGRARGRRATARTAHPPVGVAVSVGRSAK
jgi:hypothetical protein